VCVFLYLPPVFLLISGKRSNRIKRRVNGMLVPKNYFEFLHFHSTFYTDLWDVSSSNKRNFGKNWLTYTQTIIGPQLSDELFITFKTAKRQILIHDLVRIWKEATFICYALSQCLSEGNEDITNRRKPVLGPRLEESAFRIPRKGYDGYISMLAQDFNQ